MNTKPLTIPDGGTYLIPAPTVEDVFAVAAEMRLQAKKKLLSPIEHLQSVAGNLNPAFLAAAIKEALALGSGGGSEPTVAAQNDQYVSEEGLAWRFWYYHHKVNPNFSLIEAGKAVESAGRWKFAALLEEALSPDEEQKKSDPPTTGTSSP